MILKMMLPHGCVFFSKLIFIISFIDWIGVMVVFELSSESGESGEESQQC